jgi:hypothetical protein
MSLEVITQMSEHQGPVKKIKYIQAVDNFIPLKMVVMAFR